MSDTFINMNYDEITLDFLRQTKKVKYFDDNARRIYNVEHEQVLKVLMQEVGSISILDDDISIQDWSGPFKEQGVRFQCM